MFQVGRRTVAYALGALVCTACHHDKNAAQVKHTLLAGDPAVEFHASQPMVVDLHIRLSHAGTAHVTIPSDPGARPGKDPAPGTQLTVRLRGLLPGRAYTARVTARDGNGGTDSTDVKFTTRPPPPDFIPWFKPTVHGKPSPDFRIFDLSENPLITKGAIYAIAPDGKTRFFIPRHAKTKIIPAVPAGIKLLDDGTLLFVQDNHAFIVDELGKVLMDIPAKKLGVPGFHHDIIELPNGNFMALSYVFSDYFYKFDNKEHHIAGDLIVEFNRAGKVLWTWDALKHLDPLRVRDGFISPLPVIDPANGKKSNDWSHGNTLLYEPKDDSVLLSLRHQDWILKIDHKTGKVLWKLGEDGDFKLVGGGRWFFHQHSPELEPDGSILMYDNGAGNPHIPIKDWRSRPLTVKIDEKQMTARIVWKDEKRRYMVLIAGDADHLENGDINVLDSFIMLIPGKFQPTYPRIREVNPKTLNWVWSVDLPESTFAYRCICSPRLPGEHR